MKKLILLLAFMPLFTFAADQIGHIKVDLQKGIGITEGAQMDFGVIVASGEGTVKLVPNVGATITGSVTPKGAMSTNVFQIEGQPSAVYVLSLPTSATLKYGTNSLYITEFCSNITNLTGTLDANGKGSLLIGGKLTVPVSFVYGSYVGTYTITCNYQ